MSDTLLQRAFFASQSDTSFAALVKEVRPHVMSVRIILLGSRGELDRQTVEVDAHTNTAVAAAKVSREIKQALNCWVIGPGDTIRIEEVE